MPSDLQALRRREERHPDRIPDDGITDRPGIHHQGIQSPPPRGDRTRQPYGAGPHDDRVLDSFATFHTPRAASPCSVPGDAGPSSSRPRRHCGSRSAQKIRRIPLSVPGRLLNKHGSHVGESRLDLHQGLRSLRWQRGRGGELSDPLKTLPRAPLQGRSTSRPCSSGSRPPLRHAIPSSASSPGVGWRTCTRRTMPSWTEP